MKRVYERCAGIDVHKKNLTVCAITPEKTDTKTFGTTTRQIIHMIEWLGDLGIRHLAMESTGSYWKPIYNLLEVHEFDEILLVNAKHVKNVPGRKTDVKDAEWLAQLMQHGLLTGSFVPSRDQREFRELVRYRKTLIDERAREANRLQKILEGCNIKLGDVATDVTGKSGREILKALVSGVRDTEKLADMAKGRLRNKREQLVEALEGMIGPHQRMMLQIQLGRIEELDRHIETINREVEERMRPFESTISALDEIPGVGERTAQEVLAEIGTDMSQFPTHGHLASWCGMCPGNHQSAGKRQSGRTSKGNPHVRRALVQAAHSAARTRNTYLSAQFKRISARRGAKRAAVAVGHSILVAMYYMIKDGTTYNELGGMYLDQINTEETISRAVKRIQALGFDVSIQPKPDVA